MPNLTEAVRERCSLESITQPTWHSMGGLELCRVFLFLGVCKVAHNSASGSLNLNKISNISHISQLSYLGIYRSTFLYHWVKTRRHGLVLPVRRARCAWRPGTTVVGGVRHSSGKWTGYWRRLGGTKEFVRQSICWDWRRITFRVTTRKTFCVITNKDSD